MLPVAAATNGALIFFWIVHANSVKSRPKKGNAFLSYSIEKYIKV